jgi:hypothetical protein
MIEDLLITQKSKPTATPFFKGINPPFKRSRLRSGSAGVSILLPLVVVVVVVVVVPPQHIRP